MPPHISRTRSFIYSLVVAVAGSYSTPAAPEEKVVYNREQRPEVLAKNLF